MKKTINGNFKINANESIYSILSEKLYNNPQLAVFRELLTNAVDIHKETGNTEKIKVQFPSIENKYIFKVRDFGTGLTPEQIKEIYSTYGKSVKSKTTNGQFGIGSKSPFAVTNEFTVISYKDGIKYTYKMKFIDKVPTYELVSKETTDEKNGLEIKVSFEKVFFKDYYKKEIAESKILKFFIFSILPILDKIEVVNLNYILNKYKSIKYVFNLHKKMIPGKFTFEVVKNNSVTVINEIIQIPEFKIYNTAQYLYNKAIILINYKSVLYPCPEKLQIELEDLLKKYFQELRLISDFKIGAPDGKFIFLINVSDNLDIQVHPSREAIEDNHENLKRIKNIFTKELIKLNFPPKELFAKDFDNDLLKCIEFVKKEANKTKTDENNFFDLLLAFKKNTIRDKYGFDIVSGINEKILINSKYIGMKNIEEKHHYIIYVLDKSSVDPRWLKLSSINNYLRLSNIKTLDNVLIVNKKNSIDKAKKLYKIKAINIDTIIRVENVEVFEKLKEILPNQNFWSEELDKKFKENFNRKLNTKKSEKKIINDSKIYLNDENNYDFYLKLNLPIKRKNYYNIDGLSLSQSDVKSRFFDLISEIKNNLNINVRIDLNFYITKEKNLIPLIKQEEEKIIDLIKGIILHVYTKKLMRPVDINELIKEHFSEKSSIINYTLEAFFAYLAADIKKSKAVNITFIPFWNENIPKLTINSICEFIENKEEYIEKLIIPYINYEKIEKLFYRISSTLEYLFEKNALDAYRIKNIINNHSELFNEEKNYIIKILTKLNEIYSVPEMKIEKLYSNHSSILNVFTIAYLNQKLKEKGEIK